MRTSCDPQRVESDSATCAKGGDDPRRTYGNWREDGAEPRALARFDDGSSVRKSEA